MYRLPLFRSVVLALVAIVGAPWSAFSLPSDRDVSGNYENQSYKHPEYGSVNSLVFDSFKSEMGFGACALTSVRSAFEPLDEAFASYAITKKGKKVTVSVNPEYSSYELVGGLTEDGFKVRGKKPTETGARISMTATRLYVTKSTSFAVVVSYDYPRTYTWGNGSTTKGLCRVNYSGVIVKK
jgi:hypothetical protein